MIGPAASLLYRRPPDFTPIRFGPEYELAGTGRLCIKSGPLAGTDFRFTAEIGRREAGFTLYRSALDGEPAAHCHFDRDARTGLETLYSIVVRSDQRRQGLAAMLVRLSLRRLLDTGRRHSLRLRKLMVTPVEDRSDHRQNLRWGIQPDPSLENIGIGIIALELGLVPAPEAGSLLTRKTVKSMQFVPPGSGTPPGLLIRLNCLPGTMLAVLVDPQTRRPFATPDEYQRLFNPAAIFADACAGRALLGNVDYSLPPGNITSFAARIADNRKQLARSISVLRRSRMR